MFKVKHNMAPVYIREIFNQYESRRVHNMVLRNVDDYIIPHRISSRFKNSGVLSYVNKWTNLPSEIRQKPSLSVFKLHTRKYLYKVPPIINSRLLNLPRKLEMNLNIL